MAVSVLRSVMVAGCERHSMHVVMMLGRALFGVQDPDFAGFGMRGDAFHRDGRKRLNRQAQCQQHDDEEFAPI
ncbi:hypothetical protein WL87_07325 [Burkholderia diffusa]|nr:hypothetical protein WL85_02435 [Burkholderia diffusa]KWF39491.1 hypothetical protein WL87_07325 [Burkholderia diffusa]